MKCSFCGKDQNEVVKLIVASDKTAICDVCVLDCLATLIYPDEDDIIESEDEDEVYELKLEDKHAQTNSGC